FVGPPFQPTVFAGEADIHLAALFRRSAPFTPLDSGEGEEAEQKEVKSQRQRLGLSRIGKKGGEGHPGRRRDLVPIIGREQALQQQKVIEEKRGHALPRDEPPLGSGGGQGGADQEPSPPGKERDEKI